VSGPPCAVFDQPIAESAAAAALLGLSPLQMQMLLEAARGLSGGGGSRTCLNGEDSEPSAGPPPVYIHTHTHTYIYIYINIYIYIYIYICVYIYIDRQIDR